MESEVETIYKFVSQNPDCTARQIGRTIDGGKSRANHFLYGYIDILFSKKGFTPPTWRVIEADSNTNKLSDFRRRPVDKVHDDDTAKYRFEGLPSIDICESCGLPISTEGKCGCS